MDGQGQSLRVDAGYTYLQTKHKPNSIGCIMGELLIERPLFRADTDLAQLEAIFKVSKWQAVFASISCMECVYVCVV